MPLNEKWRKWPIDLPLSYITTSKSYMEMSFQHLGDLLKGILKYKIDKNHRNNLLCVNNNN